MDGNEYMELQPLIEEFRIEGLYGYRTVALSASHATTILIAKNGSGKTTLLGALDAFIRCQFGRLSNIEFSRIVCKFRGLNESLELRPIDVDLLSVMPESPEFIMAARKYGIEAQALLDFLEIEFESTSDALNLDGEDVFSKIVAKHGYNTRDAKKACEKLIDLLRGRSPIVDALRVKIREVMKGVEVLYLPTYRRIELSLSEDIDDSVRRRRGSIQSRLGLSKRGFFNTDIQFGLRDISDRLKVLNHELLAISNQGYRQISVKIISDLLDGSFEKDVPEYDTQPDKEALALFFSRIKQSGRFIFGMNDVEIPDIDKIYRQGSGNSTSDKFLNYFVSKLNEVIKASQSIEGRVDDFVNHCNEYLSARDLSTEFQQGSSYLEVERDSDEKRLRVDRMTLQVNVISVAAQKIIPMDSLSSGEKQMISLFARLYLYPGKKLILIDEPELSLSIDWQRRILLDVVKAPTCAQLIAITHSPFVFDNELDPYAKSLILQTDTSGLNLPKLGDLFVDGVSDE